MKLDIESYRHYKDTAEYKKIVGEMKQKRFSYDKISLLCATTSMNIIAIYSFIKEDVPEWAQMCDSKIKSLKEFYDYE